MNDITPAKVRSFLLTKYAEAIDMLGFKGMKFLILSTFC